MAKTSTTLNVRGIDTKAATRIKQAAAARNMTLGQYLAALSALHDAMRALAEGLDNHPEISAELKALGLQTVTA